MKAQLIIYFKISLLTTTSLLPIPPDYFSEVAAEKCEKVAKDLTEAAEACHKPKVLEKYFHMMFQARALNMYVAKSSNKEPAKIDYERYGNKIDAGN